MEDYGIEKPKIARLTGPNYRPWSIQVKTLLKGLDLWEVVENGLKGTVAKEVTGVPGEPKEGKETLIDPKLVAKNAKASSLIMGLCSREALDHILLYESASAQWKALEALYRPLGLQQLSTKIRAFTGYKVPEGNTQRITEVANHLSTLQSEIGSIEPKERPSDTLKLATLFRVAGELDYRFEPLILQLELREVPLDFENTVAKLAEWERRLGPKDKAKEGALSAQIPGKGTKGPKGKRPKGACFKCGKQGHFKAECPGTGPSTGPLSTPSGGRGLSPGPEAAKSAEISWVSLEGSLGYSDQEPVWIVDSGCSRHMIYARWQFDEYTELARPVEVTTASGAIIQGIGLGTVRLQVLAQGQIRPVKLVDVLYVPELAGSLISVLQLQNKGLTIRTTTGPKKELLIQLQGATVGTAKRVGQAYVLQGPKLGQERVYLATQGTDGYQEALKWHRRLGHLSPGTLKGLQEVTTGLDKPIKELKEPCNACLTSKSVRVINRKASEHCTKPLERVHSDFWGPYSVPSLNGEAYMLTFTDDYSRKSWVYFSKERKELRELFQVFRARVEAESGLRLKVIRCDNAQEYKALERALATTGVQFEFTTPYTPEQNGVAERLNRSLMDIARTMLQDSGLPSRFWAEAASTACYLRNRTPVGPSGITPEEAYSGKRLYIGHLRAFGCTAYAYIAKERRLKLEPNAKKMVFIGYIPTARQYRLYDPEANKVVLATAPRFVENRLFKLESPETLEASNPEGVNSEAELPEGDTIIVDTSHLEDLEIASSGGSESPESLAPVEASESEGPEDLELGGDNPLEGTEAQGPQEPPQAQELPQGRVLRPREPRNYTLLAAEKVELPRNYTEAINDPI
jgi:transposase InsO family protein